MILCASKKKGRSRRRFRFRQQLARGPLNSWIGTWVWVPVFVTGFLQYFWSFQIDQSHIVKIRLFYFEILAYFYQIVKISSFERAYFYEIVKIRKTFCAYYCKYKLVFVYLQPNRYCNYEDRARRVRKASY